MTPFYSDDWLTLYGGDCREVLASLPSDAVDCVVTSPPYWGLRDYGTAQWSGGDEVCDHRKVQDAVSAVATSTLGGGKKTTGHQQEGYAAVCGRCGATRIDSQLGLERTPEEYVANMVEVFREVRRVLKPSGTCWLNLGDSFYSSTATQGRNEDKSVGNISLGGNGRPILGQRLGMGSRSFRRDVHGLKPKDLVGIPWRVAFALQADGWYLRSDIIWAKPNPMPESVTDRPTKSHEYLFLLTKSARYYFDADAVREPHKWQDPAELAINAQARQQKRLVEREAWRDQGEYNAAMRGEREKGRNTTDHKSERAFRMTEGGRNVRSVWNIATRPYPGAHFAVFPPELPERCIKAGSPSGGVCLDPFGGSGTVGMVANRLSRRAILIDLNPEYLKQQMKRNAQTPLGLTEGLHA